MPKSKNVNFTARARKDFQDLDAATQKRVADAVRILAEDSLSGKRLKGQLSAYQSYRRGPYRIIYSFTAQSLDIIVIEHRKDVYR